MTTRRGYVPEDPDRDRRRHRDVERAALRADLADAIPPRKEQAECCLALVDELGRFWPGFCSPECIRRPGNWALVRDGKPIPEGGVPFRRRRD